MASPADLVVDTSALMAILLPEADGPSFYTRLTAARSPAISSVGKVELLIVLTSRQPATAQALFSRLRQCTALSVISVDETIPDLAIAAFARYGKGRDSAGLRRQTSGSWPAHRRIPLAGWGRRRLARGHSRPT
jgi:ribonuclease VapC